MEGRGAGVDTFERQHGVYRLVWQGVAVSMGGLSPVPHRVASWAMWRGNTEAMQCGTRVVRVSLVVIRNGRAMPAVVQLVGLILQKLVFRFGICA